MIRTNTILDRFAIISGSAVSFIGLMGLLGWVTGVRELASIRPAYLPISPDTSIAFMLLGVIVSFIVRQQYSRGSKSFVSIIIVFTAFYGLLKFLEYFLNIDLTLENIFFPVTEKIGSFTVKRMSPLAGMLFFISGIALQAKLFLGNRQKIPNVISTFGLIIMAMGFIAIVGYLYGTPMLYGGNVIPLAAPTAIGFLFLGCGLIAIAGTQNIYIRPFVGSLANARLLRILLPLIVSAILIQGLLDDLLATVLHINVAFITALLSLIFAAITAVVVVQLSRIIFRRADEADAERKLAEEALRASKEQFRLLLNSTAEAIYGVDLNGNCTFCNSAFLQILGYKHPDELLGKNMHWQIHSKHADGTPFPLEECRIFKASKKGESSHATDEVLWKADGTWFPAEYWSYPQLRDSEILGSVVTFLDITERKWAEELLAAQKRRLSDILEGTNVGTWQWDVQTGETRYNERWAEIIGYTLDELSPLSIDTRKKIVHPSDMQRSSELLAKHFRGELEYYECELRMQHKNGNWVWVLDRGKVASWTNNGKPRVMSGTHQDITQRKIIEAERENLIKELQSALDNVKTLQGLIPICANCKKIRDDSGFWQQVEGYIQKHSDIKFSHGICPECALKLYPDFVKNKQ